GEWNYTSGQWNGDANDKGAPQSLGASRGADGSALLSRLLFDKIPGSKCERTEIENGTRLENEVMESREIAKEPSSLSAIAEGPRFRLMWASFHWLKNEELLQLHKQRLHSDETCREALICGTLLHPAYLGVPIANEANNAGTRDYLVGRKLRTRWPEDHKFYAAVILDYNPLQQLEEFVGSVEHFAIGHILDRSMDSDKYLEGESMQRQPLFESASFIYWKNRFETYVKSKDLDLWHVITNGDFQPIVQNPETKLDEVIPFEKQIDDLKKRLAKNNEAKMVIYNALPIK
ncbi:hypothetical protein Tco_0902191, partial [Tanacetum coccineum]